MGQFFRRVWLKGALLAIKSVSLLFSRAASRAERLIWSLWCLCAYGWLFDRFLGGLSLHLNHLIAERVSAPYWHFGTLPIGIFLPNLVSGQLETSLMTSYCHF